MALITTALPKLVEASEAVGRTPPKTAAEIEEMHERGAQQDAGQMLKLVGEALLAPLNDPSVVSPEKSPTN